MIGRRLGVIEKSLATAQMQAPRLAYCSMGTTYYSPKPGGRKRAKAAIPCHFVGLARRVLRPCGTTEHGMRR